MVSAVSALFWIGLGNLHIFLKVIQDPIMVKLAKNVNNLLTKGCGLMPKAEVCQKSARLAKYNFIYTTRFLG